MIATARARTRRTRSAFRKECLCTLQTVCPTTSSLAGHSVSPAPHPTSALTPTNLAVAILVALLFECSLADWLHQQSKTPTFFSGELNLTQLLRARHSTYTDFKGAASMPCVPTVCNHRSTYMSGPACPQLMLGQRHGQRTRAHSRLPQKQQRRPWRGRAAKAASVPCTCGTICGKPWSSRQS